MENFLQQLFSGNIPVSELVAQVFPGALVDQSLEQDKIAVFGVSPQDFSTLAQNVDSSSHSLAIGVNVADFGEQLARHGVDYAVILNPGAVGQAPDQFPEKNAPLAALHELVEGGVVTIFPGCEQAATIAIEINSKVLAVADNLSPATIERFSIPHLKAVAAEYIAVYQGAEGTPRDRILVVEEFHQETIQVMEVHAGGISADNLVRTLVLEKLNQQGILAENQ